MNYYNEFDPKAAAWLRELIAADLIPPGDVDERSITDVRPADTKGYTSCHFFAGIGGWPYALRLAGWPDDKPVWSGSCPCQPLSCAGKQKGNTDKRHLWPDFYRLISECSPSTIFGEQVDSPLGREWLSGVRADLEDAHYAFGAAGLPAACIKAPHGRPRLYWVADANGRQREQCERPQGNGFRGPSHNCEACGMDNANGKRRDGEWLHVRPCQPLENKAEIAGGGHARRGFWDNAVAHYCKDGKWRRIAPEPALFPLANGLPGRVGILRGAGNAIVPELAAVFIQAVVEAVA